MMKKVELLLPLEITAEILSRLPADSIVECKLVCKTWRTLIDNDIGFLLAYNTSVHCHCLSSISNNSTAEVEVEAEAEAEVQPFGFFNLEENQLRYGECYKEEAHFKVTKPFNCPPLPLPPPHPHPYYKDKEKRLTTRWTILGSSNGLICLSACRFDEYERNIFTYNIYVYNPLTREFVDVPGTETHVNVPHMEPSGGFRASGFGYHPSTNEYKIVRINYESYFSLLGQVKIYTLGRSCGGGVASRSWRDKGEIPYVIRGVSKPGVLVNGALHWITLDNKILSFDLGDEKFRTVSKPWELNVYARLGVLRGCLSVGNFAEYGSTDVWVMMNNNKLYTNNSTRTDDNEPSWTRLFRTFNKPPVGYDKDDRWAFNEISSYGLKYESFGRLFYSNLHKGVFRFPIHLVPYTKSFVSLKALGEENVKKIC